MPVAVEDAVIIHEQHACLPPAYDACELLLAAATVASYASSIAKANASKRDGPP